MIRDIECLFSFKILQQTSVERSLEHNVLRQGKVCLHLQLIFEKSNISPEPSKLLG